MIYFKRHFCSAFLTLSIFFLNACSAFMMSHEVDYQSYRSHMPRSILVIPPINDSIEANASYIYLSTITKPLAEAGYYVFPVAVVDEFMKQNGLPTPEEMNSVSLSKIDEVFGADAVMYVHIYEWGQKFQVLSSDTIVKANVRLVDVKTGSLLWEGTANAIERSGKLGKDVVGQIVGAVVDQIFKSTTDHTHELARSANNSMILNTKQGLLLGPYYPTHKSSESLLSKQTQ